MINARSLLLLPLASFVVIVQIVGAQQFKEFDDVNGTLVKCHTTALNGKAFIIEVKPEWAPIGAERFIKLVESEYFTDVPFFRVVHGFLTQFGITPNRDLRKYWRAQGSILDDPSQGRQIKRGYLSFAGSGPNTRDAQLFVAFEDSDWLGKEPWEVPLGRVIEGMDVLDALYGEYGDIHPFGKGPDQQLIWQEGNEYLRRDFPRLDYFKDCKIIPDGKGGRGAPVAEEASAAATAIVAEEKVVDRSINEQEKGDVGGGGGAKMGDGVAQAAYGNRSSPLGWFNVLSILSSIAFFGILMWHLSDKKADYKGHD